MNIRRFIAMVGYVPRACLPPKRRLGLAVPIVAALLFGLIANAVHGTDVRAFATVANGGLFGLVLPLGALVIGDAVLGAEVRSGALPFTWLAPVPLHEIAIARWLGGWLISCLTLVPACAVAALLAGAPSAAGPVALAMIVALAGHIGLFVLIGSITRRAAVWSLGVVLLGERLLGAALSGIAGLSPTWLGRSVYAHFAPQADFLLRKGVPAGTAAMGRLAVITVLSLALATWGLGRLNLTGVRD